MPAGHLIDRRPSGAFRRYYLVERSGIQTTMSTSRALLLAVVTFVVCLGLCVALFIALDVRMIFLIGPAMGIAYASSYMAYRSAVRDQSG
jgi:hypothetical protein